MATVFLSAPTLLEQAQERFQNGDLVDPEYFMVVHTLSACHRGSFDLKVTPDGTRTASDSVRLLIVAESLREVRDGKEGGAA